MMQAKTIIAQYVKEMRKKYKLTQVDLSEKAGVGLRFVRELEITYETGNCLLEEAQGRYSH